MKSFFDYHPHPLLTLPWIPHWWSLGKNNILMYLWHKCGKRGHIQKDCRSKGNGSSGNSPKKSKNKLP